MHNFLNTLEILKYLNFQYLLLFKSNPTQSREVPNHEMQAIKEMMNLPNKIDMTSMPKGAADLALETMSDEEKQGYANRHKFTESDNFYLEKLQKSNDEKVDQLWVIKIPFIFFIQKNSTIKSYSPFSKLHREKMIPGTPITAPSKPANQSQYPNLN